MRFVFSSKYEHLKSNERYEDDDVSLLRTDSYSGVSIFHHADYSLVLVHLAMIIAMKKEKDELCTELRSLLRC
jgi:hypothetical protein